MHQTIRLFLWGVWQLDQTTSYTKRSVANTRSVWLAPTAHCSKRERKKIQIISSVWRDQIAIWGTEKCNCYRVHGRGKFMPVRQKSACWSSFEHPLRESGTIIRTAASPGGHHFQTLALVILFEYHVYKSHQDPQLKNIFFKHLEPMPRGLLDRKPPTVEGVRQRCRSSQNVNQGEVIRCFSHKCVILWSKNGHLCKTMGRENGIHIPDHYRPLQLLSHTAWLHAKITLSGPQSATMIRIFERSLYQVDGKFSQNYIPLPQDLAKSFPACFCTSSRMPLPTKISR